MDYLCHYMKLVNRAKNRVVDGYSEEHHIIPKSIFTSKYIRSLIQLDIINVNNEKNVVRLTFREHYIAHALLVRICKDNKNCYLKMHNAFNLMKNRNTSNRTYDLFKESYRSTLSESKIGKPSPAKGKKWSDESVQQRRDTHYMKGKTYEEIYGEDAALEMKKKRSEVHSNKIVSDETRRKISERTITDETRRKISEAKKGRPASDSLKKSISEFMSDPDKNPCVHQTLYVFQHTDGRIVIARKYDMKKKYGCSQPHKLIDGRLKISGGWSFIRIATEQELNHD